MRVSLLLVDELTPHLSEREKARACSIIEQLGRATALVIDHDVSVQGHFDTKLLLQRDAQGARLSRI